MNQEDRILITGLEFYAYHGASDQEQTVGHRYLVDVTLFVDTHRSGASDDLHDTVSYSRVAKRIVEIATTEQFRLLEALARRLTSALLLEFCLVQALELRVQKMVPPMNAIVAAVGVQIYRERDCPVAEDANVERPPQ